jgi:hypothetical protein
LIILVSSTGSKCISDLSDRLRQTRKFEILEEFGTQEETAERGGL